MKGGLAVNNVKKMDDPSRVFNDTSMGTRVALWWLRHYDSTMHFWRGFSWAWVIGLVLSVIAGHLDLGRALFIILFCGVVGNTGIYLSIRAMGSHLNHLQDGPEKEEAHDLMIKIIRKRVPNGA
jgi:hypothetical protein